MCCLVWMDYPRKPHSSFRRAAFIPEGFYMFLKSPAGISFWLFELSLKNPLIIKVQRSQPMESTASSVKKVQTFMRTDGLAKNLRLSALGLQLCLIATNLTEQKQTRQSSCQVVLRALRASDPALHLPYCMISIEGTWAHLMLASLVK